MIHLMRNLIGAIIMGACALARVGGAGLDTGGPALGKPWTLPVSNSVKLDLIWIQPGTFTMGSPDSEPGRKADEAQFTATLTHGYWMGATEITVAQWRSVMGTDLRAHLAKVIKDDTLYPKNGG